MRRVIETWDGKVFDVTNLLDANGRMTNDLTLAHSCVVKESEDAWHPIVISDVLIYAVH